MCKASQGHGGDAPSVAKAMHGTERPGKGEVARSNASARKAKRGAAKAWRGAVPQTQTRTRLSGLDAGSYFLDPRLVLMSSAMKALLAFARAFSMPLSACFWRTSDDALLKSSDPNRALYSLAM